jgi:hypothetical protein
MNPKLSDLKKYATKEHQSVICIDIKLLPKEIEFYYNPLYGKESVFTKDIIPPSAIINTFKL